MVDSKFFGIPFATSGDKATIPEAVQPSGAISFTQGYGPDYERDPATDPLAKRVPRDETNELYYQITNSLRYLQLYGLPQYTSVADGGPANYPVTARVRHDAGAGMQAWVSLVASNTAVPGSDATKWALDEFFNLAALEATLAEAIAGVIATKIITPRRLASAAQQGTWSYITAGGSANALTAALAPAVASLTAGLVVNLKVNTANTGAATLNVNGLGAAPIVRANGGPLVANDLIAGEIVSLIYDGTSFRVQRAVGSDVVSGSLIARRIFTASATYTPTPGTVKIHVTATGGGGGGGGSQATGVSQYAAGGGGGGGATTISDFSSGFSSVAMTIGAGGAGGAPGGTTSFGALTTAVGGSAGASGVQGGVVVVQAGGPGGVASGGNFLNVSGGSGGISIGSNSDNFSSGFGGQSYWGAGANAKFSSSANGNNASNYGSGGGGAVSNASSGTRTGGSGASGIIVVEEYA